MFSRLRAAARTVRQYSTTQAPKPSSTAGRVGVISAAVVSGAAGVYFGSTYFGGRNDIYTRSTAPLDAVPPLQYADKNTYEVAIAEMKQVVGEDNWSVSEDEILAVSDLFFSTHRPPKPAENKPSIIISPADTQQVSQIVQIAHKYRVPIVANSGMTSLEGHTMHTRGPYSVSLSFSRMNKILEFHPDDLDVVVQPAVGWQELAEFLQDHEKGKRLIFGPDPGMGATVGGMASTSASGTNAYRYGTMKENVVNMTVVLADGTILKTRQRPRKSSAGYDLTRLFIGSEGTLGLITEITIKLHVKPVYEYVSIATFPTMKDATKTASTIVAKSGLQLNAIELLDTTMVGFVNAGGITDAKGRPKVFLEKPTLLLKIGGPTKESIHQDTKLVQQIAKDNGVVKFESSTSEEENALLWSARRNGLFSTIEHGQKVLDDPNDVQCWTTDIAVPLSNLPDVISETHDDLNRSGFKGKFATMGHIGDGNCHFLLLYNKKDYGKAQAAVDRMVERTLQFEGTCTGEHGVGVGKRRFLPVELGQPAVDLMRKIKYSLDPHAVLNPDKVVKLEAGDPLDELLEAGHVAESGKGCC
ncbi:FAD-binding D-lactate dehydrogenase [cytochrome] [Yamadazyma tenuis]|uniref:D-lactate dehydrogenase (cytochrome) n=1 Tax=Candida tenuis (strain ATCC 10573 / BCRC 21748 / CBS 615 / JCM 9827 / NBRC 10315 / NRRL Y-1498 / VKM Y-70) TaxID=590646 RepID=G3B5B8_CANTC|nr:uncharacterized protein CANTEDRAFT_123073 [Yamadazyma tenuis ATCC 10573]EGV63179.1 hypothetical protein CANTEDRAFT_123073 [Yamadazyma tenuis ATCC 10573]WEJ96998.1 FAD-binding D-lactate dehydrogenase [cytochrome] [Yamadazyma tenuis]